MSDLLTTLKPELAAHNDGSDATYTLDQSSVLTTPPGPVSEDSSPIGGGFLLSVVDIGTIDYVIILAKCYLVNPVTGDPGTFQNSRIQWIQDNAPNNTSVSGCNCIAGSNSVTEPAPGDFGFVKIGQKVTVDVGDTVTLPADTFVTSIFAGVIVLSNVFGGSSDASTTLYFNRSVQAYIASISEVEFVWIITGNLTTSPDNNPWTWITLKNFFRDVSPMGTFYQDIEPATTVMEIRCSEVEVQVWGQPFPKSFSLVLHQGNFV